MQSWVLTEVGGFMTLDFKDRESLTKSLLIFCVSELSDDVYGRSYDDNDYCVSPSTGINRIYDPNMDIFGQIWANFWEKFIKPCRG